MVELVACILIPVQVGTEYETMKSCDICDLCLVMSPINSMGGSRDKPHKPRNDSPLLQGISKIFGAREILWQAQFVESHMPFASNPTTCLRR